jgi:hypothetical protein
LEFAEKTLEWIMADGTDNLFEGLHARNILDGTKLNEPAIDALQKGARQHLEHADAETIKAHGQAA